MIWNFDPIFIDLGFLKIHYYGVVFAIGVMLGYFLWRWQTQRQGFTEAQTEDFVLWAFIATLIGARLGHCFFYEPTYYLNHPIDIIKIWEGGLSSHGATITIIITLFIYHRVKKLKLADVCDCLSFSVATASIAIRIGNFFNSEIVGRVTDVPWAICFVRFEENPQPRHPSQLYEVLLVIIVLTALYLVDRHYKQDRPKGLLAGIFLSIYFTGRFIVEYFKEYQTLTPDNPYTLGLTMGQILSIPFAIAGFIIIGKIIFCKKNK